MIISQHTSKFIKNYIKTTEKIDSVKKLKQLDKYNFDAFLVGSDQVWRPNYSPYLPNFFLDFVPDERKVKRITYAASFGTDKWEFTLQQTAYCAPLAQKFDAVSVREESGIRLCKEKLGVDAIQVLDPTLLLDKEDYIKLAESEKASPSPGNLLIYAIDKSQAMEQMIQKVSKVLNLSPFSVMPPKLFSEIGSKHIDQCIFPPVTSWLRGFMDAKFVITDSFHGTAFSILFNKPFISIANEIRGKTRFESLLKIFNLNDRLVSLKNIDLEKLPTNPINFDEPDKILIQERKKSIEFLSQHLK